VNRYQLLKQHEEIIYLFVKNGILSYQIIRDMEIYDSYLELDENIKELKYIELGEIYELSSKRIEQIIYQMERTIS
jgi:hypothetical protein